MNDEKHFARFDKTLASNNSSSHNNSRKELEAILDGNYSQDQYLDGGHVLVVTLCIFAIIINTVTLTAIRHIRRRLTANQTMMFSLCCADLLTSIAFLAEVTTDKLYYRFNVDEKDKGTAFCVHKVVQAFIMTGHNATLFTLFCLSVDHYCAIAKPLTHSLYMSKRNVHIMLAAFWLTAILFGFSDFIIPSALHSYCQDENFVIINYCERIDCTFFEPDHLMFTIVGLTIVVMSIMYGRIICILYCYQQQDYASATQRKAKRHIRGLITSFIVLGLFVILWMPNCVYDIVIIVNSMDDDFTKFYDYQKYYLYLYALVIINAVFDPIVYAMRMREIQESLKLLLCFRRPNLVSRMKGVGEAIQQTSSTNNSRKHVQRQSSNHTTISNNYSMNTITSIAGPEARRDSRKNTLTSQTSAEEALLNNKFEA